MSKSKGRLLAEWLRNLNASSQATTNTIADDAITNAKIADDAVDTAQIADDAVHTANLADENVTFAKLHTALVVTESDAISSNDNDITVPTSAAVVDYISTYIAGNQTYGNITTTGYIAGPSTFTIDPAAVGDNTGTLVVAGNLQVDGTTTTINSTTMTVDDLNITLASGAANAAAANGAGITVDGASATLTYNSTPDAWSFNKNVGIGTTSPSFLIEAYGATNASTGWNAGGTVTGFAQANTSNSDFRIGTTTNHAFGLYTQAIERMLIDTSGNVGIGTSTLGSSSKLTVAGSNGTTGLEIIPNDASGEVVLQAYERTGSAFRNLGHTASSFTWDIGGGSEAMRIDASGNVGIGNSSPSAWLSSFSALQIGQAASFWAVDNFPYAYMSANQFYDGASKYIVNAPATWYVQELGSHKWFTAPSGTAGATISFTQAMTLDSSGNLGIGTTSPSSYNSGMDDLVISRAGDSGITIVSGTTSEGSIAFADGTSGADTYRGWINYNHNSNFLRFATNATVRMYIDSAGKIGIGNQNPSGSFHLNTVDASGSDVYYVAQNTTASRIAGYRILDESNNIGGVFQYDNGGNNLLIGTTLASNFQFITNNTERMRINTDGSIAFSPNAGTVGQAALSINASGSSYAELDAFMWGVGWNMPLVLQRQAGNVGIGTTIPYERLHVSGNIRAGVSVTSFQNGSANDNYIGVGSDNGGDAWFIAHASGYGVALMGYESAGDRLLIGCDNGAGNNKIDFSLNMGTNAAGTVENTSGATPAVRINASGNLLVGTTNASGSLSNTANTTSGSFKTQSGSVTQTGGSGWYSAFTIPNSQTGLYLLHVYVNGYVAGPSDWSNAFVISHTGAGNTAYLWNLSGANTGNIQARITSVANVEFYLIGGTNINYGYSLTRLH